MYIHIYIYIHTQWGETNIRSYENYYLLSFKHSLSKILYSTKCVYKLGLELILQK